MKIAALSLAALASLQSVAVTAQSFMQSGPESQSHDDLFENAIIDMTSPILSGFSAADAFGAQTPGSVWQESFSGGTVIFSDDLSLPFINFHTVTPVSIAGFRAFVSSDGYGNSHRGFSDMRLYASHDDGLTFSEWLGQTSYDPASGSVVTGSLFAPVTAQYFRFEGTAPNGGGRLVELDAITAVPEPATWALLLVGFGAVGYGMRRHHKVVSMVSYAI